MVMISSALFSDSYGDNDRLLGRIFTTAIILVEGARCWIGVESE